MPTNPPTTDPEAFACAAHPRVETYLRCGRCETPICPRCLVQTPVGARCRACARLRRLPMYDVNPRFLLRGGLAALFTSTVGSLALHLVPRLELFVALIVGGLFGIVVAGAASLATNRKRGTSLSWATVGAIVGGWVLSSFVLLPLLVGVLVGLSPRALLTAARLLPSVDELLLLAVAAVVAYNRLR